MNDTLDTYEAYLALSPGGKALLKRHIFDTAIRAMKSEKRELVLVPTTNGRFLYVEISMRISTPVGSGSGGCQ